MKKVDLRNTSEPVDDIGTLKLRLANVEKENSELRAKLAAIQKIASSL